MSCYNDYRASKIVFQLSYAIKMTYLCSLLKFMSSNLAFAGEKPEKEEKFLNKKHALVLKIHSFRMN